MTATLENKTVKVRILEKEVQMSCPANDEENLVRASGYVDKAMQDFRQRNFSASIEKIAIVTAINIANELLRSGNKPGGDNNEELVARISDMQKLVETALEPNA